MWLSARADVIETACARGAFAKAARGPIAPPQDLAGAVFVGLSRRIGDLLGLARRAGQAVAGYETAREWVRTGRAALVLQASDGSAKERQRLLSGAGGLTVLAPLPATALGAVFGREHVVHVAVSGGRLAAALTTETERLSGLIDPATELFERESTSGQVPTGG